MTEISINIKGLKEGVTVGDLQKLEKDFNSLFNSDVINLKCVNGDKPHLVDSQSPFTAQDVIDELNSTK